MLTFQPWDLFEELVHIMLEALCCDEILIVMHVMMVIMNYMSLYF